MQELTYIFVYGSLKRGYWSHRYVRDQEFVGEFVTEPRYKLYELDNRLPVLVENLQEGLEVQGEVYLVDPDRLAMLDMYERGAGYDRQIINLKGWDKGEPCLVYLYTQPFVAKKDWGTSWAPSDSYLRI